MSVRKVVIPVAGLGTRLLPTTKALPKEMLPVGRLPAIQHVVEEMAEANLKKVIFITSRGKAIIENQFDDNVDVAIHLEQDGRLNDLGDFDYTRRGIEFFYTRQHVPPGTTKPQGTGAAIAAAQSFVDDEHFVVAYGDTIISSTRTPSFLERLIEAHLKHNATCTLGVRPVPPELVSRYGVVQPVKGEDLSAESFLIEDVVEKPAADEAPSSMAVSARYIFGPEIFEFLERIPPSEHQLTDAIRGLIRSGHMVRCVQMKPDEIRYDIGSHETYYKAFIDFALQDPNCGENIRHYIETCVGRHSVGPTAGKEE